MLQTPVVDSRVKNPAIVPAVASLRGEKDPAVGQFYLLDMVRDLPDQPKMTALLGQTIDSLPLLFNLLDSRPGSLLITAEQGMGKTSLLKTITTSLALLNRPEQVRFAVISTRPAEWMEMNTRFPGYFMNIISSQVKEVGDVIYHLCDLVEARQNGMHTGTTYLLLFDGLEATASMEEDLRANFEWLVRCGASLRIWTVAALDSAHLLTNFHSADLFKTRIIGTVRDRQVASRLLPSGLQSLPDETRRFTVRIRQHWVQFRVPEIG